jgi:hypothetical protein
LFWEYQKYFKKCNLSVSGVIIHLYACSHLTSKLYVDNQVALTAKLALPNIFTGLQNINGNLKVDNIESIKFRVSNILTNATN